MRHGAGWRVFGDDGWDCLDCHDRDRTGRLLIRKICIRNMKKLTKESVKKDILKKFTYMSHFAKLAGIDRYDLQKFFAKAAPSQEELSELAQKVHSTDFRPSDDHIPQKSLDALKEAIMKEGSLPGFCIQNPEFKESSVKSIIYGKRTRMSPGVRKLLAHFNIAP